MHLNRSFLSYIDRFFPYHIARKTFHTERHLEILAQYDELVYISEFIVEHEVGLSLETHLHIHSYLQIWFYQEYKVSFNLFYIRFSMAVILVGMLS